MNTIDSNLQNNNIAYNIIEVNNLNINNITKIYKQLLKNHPHSYFLSQGWVETWLEQISNKSDIAFIYATIGKIYVLGFFLGLTKKFRFFYEFKVQCLNETGKKHFDILCIEYNSIIKDKNLNFDILEVLQKLKIKYHKIKFSFIDEDLLNNILENTTKYKSLKAHNTRKINTYFVEFEKIRNNKSKDYYLSLLSSNTRSQIRRSIKKLNFVNPIEIKEASTVLEALDMLESLIHYHQERWKSKQETGVFANNFFLNFHKNLISKRFKYKEIQILHIYSGENTIAFIYNFIYDLKVLFYQCGINYNQSATSIKPGYVAHYYSILYNLEKGYNIYDFLAGEAQYKKSLSTTSALMYKTEIKKISIINTLEEIIGKINYYISAAIRKIKLLINGFIKNYFHRY